MTKGPGVALFLLAAVSVPAQRQPAPPATGLIVGQVVDAESGRPVGECIATLSPAGPLPAGLAASMPGAQKVITDANGRFVFRDLSKGRYSISTVKPGYVTGLLGKTVPRGPGAALELADGERVLDVRIPVWKHAAITGRVVDEVGEPVVGAEIRVKRVSQVAGRPGFQTVASISILTDDRGTYRVPALEPSSYVVGVSATSTTIPAPMIEEYSRATGTTRTEMAQALFAAAPTMSSPGSEGNQQIGDHILQVNGRMPTPPEPRPGESLALYTAVYYPQTAFITEATVLNLKGGETRSGIDFSIRPQPTVSVSGRLQGSEAAIGIATLYLLPANADGPVGTTTEAVATTVSDARGAFTFLGVPAGTYSLFVMKWPLASAPAASQVTVVQGPDGSSARGVASQGSSEIKPAFWSQQTLAVGGSAIADLAITMRAGLRVSGRVVAEGSSTLPMQQRLAPFLEPTATWMKPVDLGESTLAADGAFSLPGVPAGRYLLTVPVPSGWYVKSALAAGRELSDLPFDLQEDVADVVVTVSNRGARVAGAVRDRAGKPNSGASLIIFPIDSRYWVDFSAFSHRIRDTRVGRDGTFGLSDLPAGEYFVAAVAPSALDWSMPRLFERFSQIATKITLAEGEQRTVDLQTAQVR